jgi:hypothetical protein
LDKKLKRSNLLNKLYGDLHNKHLKVEKTVTEVDKAQGDLTLYLTIASVSLQVISTMIDVFTLFDKKSANNSDVKYFINVIYKNGQVVKQGNLTSKEKIEKLKVLKEQFDEVSYIEIG